MRQEHLLPFKLSQSKRFQSKITSYSGLPLILETYRALGLDRVVQRELCFKQRGWEENTILEELIALQVAGGDCMDDVDYLKVDDSKVLSGYVQEIDGVKLLRLSFIRPRISWRRI